MAEMTTSSTTPICRPPEDFCLPPGYRQQTRNLTLDTNRDDESYWSPWRIGESGKWQHHVYSWAARLGSDHALDSVLDVGCGVCTKLQRHLVPAFRTVEGMDQGSALSVARRRGVGVTLTDVDLENPPSRQNKKFDLIVCADVVEHLVDPDPMLQLIRECSHADTLVLISTPERDRERGRECRSSDKPEHVREWNRSEFRRFLVSRGFRPLSSVLMPKDDAERAAGRELEVSFRLGQAARSPWCCQAWLCRVDSARTRRAGGAAA